MSSIPMQAVPTQSHLPHLMPNSLQTPPTSTTTVTDEVKLKSTWQYYGYPRLSEWMASSDDFFMLRRFSKINARYLLYLQHEIGKREHKLEDMDRISQSQPPGYGPCGSFEKDRMPGRTELIEDIGTQLGKYYDHINAYSQVRNKRTADRHHLQNLDDWFVTYRNAIVDNEKHWWDRDGNLHTGDLFEMKSYPKTPLRWLLNKSRIMQLAFRLRNRKPEHFEAPSTRYFSNAAFDQFVCLVTVLVGLGLLFAPMWYLHYVNDVDHMLGPITGFVSLFAFWLWVAAGPRQFEILLGTAAYAAVLYIYLQAATGGSRPERGVS